MLTLTLLRHAKSSWDDPGLADHDRPLAPRGLKAASAMAKFLAGQRIAPDIILCSTAMRTRRTLEIVREALGGVTEVSFTRRLYLASPTELLALARETPQGCRHLMLVGHNPGLQALALDLVGLGPAPDIVALARKLPTAGLVAVEFDVDAWHDVRPTTGRLRVFMTPKLLGD